MKPANRCQCSILFVVLAATLLADCAAIREPASDTSHAIPITFEVYSVIDISKPLGYFNRRSISRLLKSECIYRVDLDARAGVPVAMIRATSYRFNKGLVSVPERGFLRETIWLRHLLPEDFQRIGGLDMYLIHVSPGGLIESVLHEDRYAPGAGGSWLFDQCRPGDRIVAEPFF